MVTFFWESVGSAGTNSLGPLVCIDGILYIALPYQIHLPDWGCQRS